MIARCRELKLRLAVPEDAGPAGVHRAADGADHELPAQRPPPAGAVKPLRVLALVHKHLVPPEDTDRHGRRQRRVEDGVRRHRSRCEERGHEVRSLGVHDDLAPIRAAIDEFKPHIVFNLLEAFDDVDDVRPERRQLPRAAAPALHRLQSARPDARARQGARRRSCSPTTASRSPTSPSCRRGRRRSLPKRLQLPADREVARPTRRRSASRRRRSSRTTSSSRGACSSSTRASAPPPSSSSSSTAASSTSACIGNERLQVFPVWEMSFAKMPERHAGTSPPSA